MSQCNDIRWALNDIKKTLARIEEHQVAAPTPVADSGATSDFPNDGAIARSKRILAMVDTYNERPDRMNRSALRGALMDEFTELLAAEKPVSVDAVCQCGYSLETSCNTLDPTCKRTVSVYAGLIDETRESLECIRRYGLDTLSGRVDGPDDRDWQRESVNEMTKRARLAIEHIDRAALSATGGKS